MPCGNADRGHDGIDAGTRSNRWGWESERRKHKKKQAKEDELDDNTSAFLTSQCLFRRRRPAIGFTPSHGRTKLVEA